MKNNPVSIAMVAAVLAAFAALYLSTSSPFVLVLPLFFVASLLLPGRFERDAGGIWGVRLLLYVGFAVLGRTPTGTPNYFVDSQAFTTAGLIAGGELCLQAFRRPPPGARFDPWIVSLSGVVFLIACNTNRFHIWFLAPLYMLFLLLSLNDLQPRVAPLGRFAGARRLVMVVVAVTLGGFLHQSLWLHRNSITAAGARLMAAAPLSEQASRQSVQQGDNPQLSDTFGGNTSTARLMRVQGNLKSGRLRAASFGQYSEGQWGPTLSQREPLSAALPQNTGEEDKQRQNIPRSRNDAKITLLRDTGGTLFAPLNAHAIMPEIGQSFNWDRFQGPFKTEEPTPVVYYFSNAKKSLGDWEIEQGPLCVAPNPRQRRLLMTVPPEIDPKVGELAREISKTGRTQAVKAAQIIHYLLRTNHYSLNFARRAQEPISDFVLNRRAGHCQYFASASVMMLRAIGIPARYVSGYFAQELDKDGTLIVRGRDAHAWTEAYLDNIGWVSLDATPPSGRADPDVNPTPFYQPVVERTEDFVARVRAWFGRLTQLQIGAIMLVILTLWSLERARQGWLSSRRKQPGQTPPPALAPLARRFERLLKKRGVTLSQGRPWSESVSETLPDARGWVANYNRARFAQSQGNANAEELHALERELEALEK